MPRRSSSPVFFPPEDWGDDELLTINKEMEKLAIREESEGAERPGRNKVERTSCNPLGRTSNELPLLEAGDDLPSKLTQFTARPACTSARKGSPSCYAPFETETDDGNDTADTASFSHSPKRTKRDPDQVDAEVCDLVGFRF